jgi:hypothetical protein
MSFYTDVLHRPARAIARVVIPSDQPDFLTATKFVNILIKGGVVVHHATAPFTASGKTYPAGSYVVKTAQPFRAHVMDMFEPQDHPNDIPYPGGPPRPPYDVTGYNPAYSMGIVFDRILDGFEGPFEKVADAIKPLPGRFTAAPQGGAYVISAQVNDAFVALNRLLQANQGVSRAARTFNAGGRSHPAGSIIAPATATTSGILQKAAAEKGLTIDAIDSVPAGDRATVPVRPVRVGLWDTYGGSMPSGHVRWLLEQFEFPFQVVFPRRWMRQPCEQVRRAHLRRRAIPMRDGTGEAAAAGKHPREFANGSSVSVSRTVPELRKFVEAGGRLIAIGSSTAIGYHLGLPIRNALVERGAAVESMPLPSEKFFIPGSILEARVDTSHPLAYGLSDRVNVFFDDSPSFAVPDATSRAVVPVAWFDRRHCSRAVGVGQQPWIRRCRSSMRRSEGTSAVWAGNRLAGAAARHVQVPVQRDLFAVATNVTGGRCWVTSV